MRDKIVVSIDRGFGNSGPSTGLLYVTLLLIASLVPLT